MIDLDSSKLKTDPDQTTYIDNVPFHNLSLGQDGQNVEEAVKVTQSLFLLPTDTTNTEGATKNKPGEEGEEQTEMELRL